ncbi:MAG: RNA-binding S4 domain-containing protein [Bacteroidales bacterium]
MAKLMVDEGLVKLNGETEYRKRAKVKPGDVVEAEGYQVLVEL